jgi:hypothetical protein
LENGIHRRVADLRKRGEVVSVTELVNLALGEYLGRHYDVAAIDPTPSAGADHGHES